jgi:hypothetical protein
MKTLALLLLVLFLGGCGNKRSAVEQPVMVEQGEAIGVNEAAQAPKDPWLYYERTACFGTCPVYKFTLNHDGKCTYEGINFVDRIGFYRGTVADSEAFVRIRKVAEQLDYFALEESYDDSLVMDLPSYYTLIDGKGVLKRMGGPNLKALYDVIDEVIEEVSWEPSKQ